MKRETDRAQPNKGFHHEGGDPTSLKQDPAQFYPTGGAGLVHHDTDAPQEADQPPDQDATKPAQQE